MFDAQRHQVQLTFPSLQTQRLTWSACCHARTFCTATLERHQQTSRFRTLPTSSLTASDSPASFHGPAVEHRPRRAPPACII
jgi:hypothetical protein